MLKRIITAFCAFALMIPVLWFSDTIVLPVALAFVSVFCLFEMFRCIGMHKNLAITIPLYILGALAPVAERLWGLNTTTLSCMFIYFVLYVIYAFAIVVWSGDNGLFNSISTTIFISLYIIAAVTMICYTRDFSDIGKYAYLLIFIGAWTTDIFAYFTGVFLGKHKLIEKVSPKKTVEGSIGGIIFCSIAFVLTGLVLDSWFGCDANIIFLGASGIVVSVISQIGDLIMSVIKRNFGVKDYGKLFPGHGGMLDRFDSILAVSLGVAAMCMLSSVMGVSLL